MAPAVYLRLFIIGAVFSIVVLFSPVLAAQAPAISQTVGKPPPSSERWALVIGVSKYDDPSFNPLYGQDDARKIASDLVQYAGFDPLQVIVLSDDQPKDRQPRRERILFWLSDLKQNASPQGLLLVFFSGHGMESGGESFLMPQEAYYNEDTTYLEQNAVPVKVVSKMLGDSLTKQVIVLVDACRNNPYAAAGRSSNRMTSTFADSFDYEKQNLGKEAYVTIFSTSLGEESFQYQSKRMGYFSWVLDQALSGAYDPGGGLTLESLIDDLQSQVPKLVRLYNPGRTQKPDPHLGGYLADQLVLVGTRAPSPSPATLPAIATPAPSAPIVSAIPAPAPSAPTVSPVPTLPPSRSTVPVKETGTELARTGSLSRFSGIKGWAVGSRGIILHTDDGGASWNPQSSGTPSLLESVAFVTPLSGWAVGGGYGEILHTEDGGNSWKAQITKTTVSLDSIAFVTPHAGWAVGLDGTILHTEDGGSTWTKQNSHTDESLVSVAFADPQTGWAVGPRGTILQTKNGGASWTRQHSGSRENFNAVTFSDSESGWVVGDFGTIMHTDDGGGHWTQQRTPFEAVGGTAESFESIVFVTRWSGWVVGNRGTILHTEDGGVNWMQQNSGTKLPLQLHSVFFATPKVGWAVGSELLELTNRTFVLYTEDGGLNWAPQSSGTLGELVSAAFVSLH
jgi:photosystem II stability/assembly factor-like uncharacterized protein